MVAPLCSCLENPTDRRAWQATVHRVAELDMTEGTWHAHHTQWKGRWHVGVGAGEDPLAPMPIFGLQAPRTPWL